MLQLPAATAAPSRELVTSAPLLSQLYFILDLFRKVFGYPKIKIYGTLLLLEKLQSQSVQLAGRSSKSERRAHNCVELTLARQWKAASFGSHAAMGFFQ